MTIRKGKPKVTLEIMTLVRLQEACKDAVRYQRRDYISNAVSREEHACKEIIRLFDEAIDGKTDLLFEAEKGWSLNKQE